MNFSPRIFLLFLLTVFPFGVNARVEEETCEKSSPQKRSLKEEEAQGDLDFDWEKIRKHVGKYTEEANDYATSNEGWLEIYRRQQAKEEVGECMEHLSHAEIINLMSSPMATLFSEEDFQGDSEDYNFQSAKYIGGCHDLAKLKGNVRSVDTKKKCLRLFDNTRCIGLSLAIYLGSRNSHQVLSTKLTKVESIGPCLEEEFHGSFFLDQSKNGVSKRRSDSSGGFFPDLIESHSQEKYDQGNEFPRTSYSHSKFTLGPKNWVEYLYVRIKPKHLIPDSEEHFYMENSTYVQSLDKNEGDVLGFGIPPKVGGPVDENFNIFPQSPSFHKA